MPLQRRSMDFRRSEPRIPNDGAAAEHPNRAGIWILSQRLLQIGLSLRVRPIGQTKAGEEFDRWFHGAAIKRLRALPANNNATYRRDGSIRPPVPYRDGR